MTLGVHGGPTCSLVSAGSASGADAQRQPVSLHGRSSIVSSAVSRDSSGASSSLRRSPQPCSQPDHEALLARASARAHPAQHATARRHAGAAGHVPSMSARRAGRGRPQIQAPAAVGACAHAAVGRGRRGRQPQRVPRLTGPSSRKVICSAVSARSAASAASVTTGPRVQPRSVRLARLSRQLSSAITCRAGCAAVLTRQPSGSGGCADAAALRTGRLLIDDLVRLQRVRTSAYCSCAHLAPHCSKHKQTRSLLAPA